jgi:hypothetical protein
MDNENDEEFLKILHSIEDSTDCPEDLLKLANTPFERTVCIEFFKLYKEFQAFKTKAETNFAWLKWLIMGVFSITTISLVLEIVKRAGLLIS